MAGVALSVKELLLIVAIAATIFALGRPIAVHFVHPQDFARRRNIWLVLTAAAFLSPNFWVFSAVAAPVLLVAGLRDSCPAALYLLLLHVIPPFSLRVPMIGISYLLDIDMYLLLSFFVMTPAMLRLRHSKNVPGSPRPRGLLIMDLCILGYGILQSILYIHPQNPDGTLVPATATDSLRRACEFLFANFVPYYVISRSAINRKALFEMMAMFCLASGVMAAVAMFEAAKHWLLYGDLAARWGHAGSISLYLSRNDSLRAMASSGHPLALGYLLAVAFGFWMVLRNYEESSAKRIAVTLLFWGGLLATYSRGPWIGAVVLYLVFSVLRPGGASTIIKAVGLAVMAGLAISLTPLREKIVSVMPFLGGRVDYGNVLYRQMLVQRAWEIIKGNLMLGDQRALLRMEDLRQGQGIIDVVDTYVQIALANGIVGLSLFLTFIGIAAGKVWRFSRRVAGTDPALGMLGASILSCIVATLLMLEDGSFGTGVEKAFYILAALAAAYVQLQSQPARRAQKSALYVAPGRNVLIRGAQQHRLRPQG